MPLRSSIAFAKPPYTHIWKPKTGNTGNTGIKNKLYKRFLIIFDGESWKKNSCKFDLLTAYLWPLWYVNAPFGVCVRVCETHANAKGTKARARKLESCHKHVSCVTKTCIVSLDLTTLSYDFPI